MGLENTPIQIHIDSAKEYIRLAKHFKDSQSDISTHFRELAEEQIIMAEICIDPFGKRRESPAWKDSFGNVWEVGEET